MCYIICGLGAVTGLSVSVGGNGAGIQVFCFIFLFLLKGGKGACQDSGTLTDFLIGFSY